MADTGSGGLVLAGLIALALLSRQEEEVPPPPNGAGGTAVPEGAINSVDVAQEGQAGSLQMLQAFMGIHSVPKTAGDTIVIDIPWSALTKNAAGQAISWNYGISWRYRHARTGSLLAGGFFVIGSRPNGAFVFTVNDTDSLNPLNYPLFQGKDWDVQVALHADSSSPTGEPLGDMVRLEDDALFLSFREHPAAFSVT